MSNQQSSRKSQTSYQLTLGRLISILKRCPKGGIVIFSDGSCPVMPHSYRGNYTDLAMEQAGGGRKVLVRDFLKSLKTEVLGKTFDGYNGGTFVMEEDTPVWRAYLGIQGLEIIDVDVKDNKVVLKTRLDK